MVFWLIGIILFLTSRFPDNANKQLEEDKKIWERIMGREYDI
jgi:hypothetical protein